MTIKVLLTLGLLGAFSYVFVQSGTLRLIKLTTTVVIVLGIYFVWLPTHATLVAEVLGVGRGADLLMYFWIMVTLIVLLNLQLKLRAINIMLTKLTRHIAKLEATGTKEMDGERSS
jgi:hypothetical protein